MAYWINQPSQKSCESVPTIIMHKVTQVLISMKRTASGPDDLPYWLFHDFGYHLAPVIADVFNDSLSFNIQFHCHGRKQILDQVLKNRHFIVPVASQGQIF